MSGWTDGEIEGVAVRPLRRYEDGRGWLAELFRADEMAPGLAPRMAYISVTRPGMGRGPHEHREQTDHFAFAGPGDFRVTMWDTREESPTRGRRMIVEAGENSPAMVSVPPRVVHAYRNVAAGDSLVVNLPDRLYAGEGRKEPVDEIRYENRPELDFDF